MSAGRRRRPAGGRRTGVVLVARGLGRLLCHGALDLTVVGRRHVPAHGPVIFAANHSGFLDGPLVFLLSPRRPSVLTKSELFVGPLARALRWLGQIAVHRGTPDRSALRTALQVLARNGAVGVFPEGTRGAGDLAELNDGLAYLALRSGAAVVPVVVRGTAEALPRGARRPRWRAPVSVTYGPPVHVRPTGPPYARRTVAAAGEHLAAALRAHLHDVVRAETLEEQEPA
jgi:1-acyl-sn-glycerol-3-phosphate acyltransferase